MYFIDTGLLLIVGPWTQWWRRNFFIQFAEWLPGVMASPWARLGVTILGAITLAVGLADARRVILSQGTRTDR